MRAVCFKKISDDCNVIWKTVSSKLRLQNNQMKTEIQSHIIGVKTQMESFHLYFGVNLGHRILTYTDKLSKTMQAKKMSACNSKMLAELTIQDFQNMRKEHLFNSF